MKKTFLFLLFSLINYIYVNAQIFSSKTGIVSFYSATPIEDIKAKSKNVVVAINIQNKQVVFIIYNTAFEFENKMMQEHFNEKYMESEKFPRSTFNGKINDELDLSKNGTYTISVNGKLTIHGVEKERNIAGTIDVKDGKLQISSALKIKIADHNISIPSLVKSNISEFIDVKIDATLLPKN